jgi:two-component system, chemotaxis family, protein-glutamate methylesterase/glutaminase
VHTHDIVVIGASAGGIEALQGLTSRLSQNLLAAIFVVVHVSPHSSGLLADVLNLSSKVPASLARDGERIEGGRIYVAPPDHHLLLEPDRVRVVNGPKHNRYRPAIDLLFLTAARHFGERVIGVVLTGFLEDGSSGLLAIKNAGGIAIIQSPEDAEVASMPRRVLQQVHPDYCVPVTEIGLLLNKLTTLPATAIAVTNSGAESEGRLERKRSSTSFICPDCHGAIWELNENGEIHYECRIGHSYSPDGISEAQDEDVERSLWMALRALEESAALEQRLAQLAADRKRNIAHKFFSAQAHARKQQAVVLREFLLGSRGRQGESEEEIKRVG